MSWANQLQLRFCTYYFSILWIDGIHNSDQDNKGDYGVVTPLHFSLFSCTSQCLQKRFSWTVFIRIKLLFLLSQSRIEDVIVFGFDGSFYYKFPNSNRLLLLWTWNIEMIAAISIQQLSFAKKYVKRNNPIAIFTSPHEWRKQCVNMRLNSWVEICRCDNEYWEANICGCANQSLVVIAIPCYQM